MTIVNIGILNFVTLDIFYFRVRRVNCIDSISQFRKGWIGDSPKLSSLDLRSKRFSWEKQLSLESDYLFFPLRVTST